MNGRDLAAAIFGWDIVERDFHGYEHEVSITENGETVAYVGATDREILADGKQLEVLGVGFVCTHASYRRRGFMTSLMNQVHDEGRKRGLPFALLNTGSPELYERFGYSWRMNLPDGWLACELVTDENLVVWPDFAVIDLQGSW